MKIVAINGSFRKKGNSAEMLTAFLDGVKTVHPDAEIERVFYPGHAKKTIPVTCIYTMNQPEEVMKKRFRYG